MSAPTTLSKLAEDILTVIRFCDTDEHAAELLAQLIEMRESTLSPQSPTNG